MPNGKQVFLESASITTPVPEISGVEVDEISYKNGEFQVVISGVKNQELIEKIQVPIWADVNQKDIIWYTARQDLEGNYVVDVDIADHEYRCVFDRYYWRNVICWKKFL